jgi:hypothetical protein
MFVGDFGRAEDGRDIAREIGEAGWGRRWPSRCRPSSSGCS